MLKNTRQYKYINQKIKSARPAGSIEGMSKRAKI